MLLKTLILSNANKRWRIADADLLYELFPFNHSLNFGLLVVLVDKVYANKHNILIYPQVLLLDTDLCISFHFNYLQL